MFAKKKNFRTRGRKAARFPPARSLLAPQSLEGDCRQRGDKEQARKDNDNEMLLRQKKEASRKKKARERGREQKRGLEGASLLSSGGGTGSTNGKKHRA